MKRNKFKLSPSGKLIAAVAIISASIATCYATGIVGAGDNQPNINQAGNGATVVDIVKPNASGLSHNTYDKFNVEKQGAVFNNAIEAGNSQLAGALEANKNFNGQAAKIILNEVISRNPSMLLGQQEVFGMAADYILANPNGITCNGCGFINTTKSSLVVGTPKYSQNGDFGGFSNLSSADDNVLKIGEEGLTTKGYLNLIAPRIHSEGKISADEINVIAGKNDINILDNISNSSRESFNLDSHFLGGMQAGRIRIVNTAVTGDLTLDNNISANKDIDITTKKSLVMENKTNMQGGDINIKANDIELKSNIYKYNNDGGKSTEQTLDRVELKGKNISLVANKKNHLSAAKIEGENVTLKGGELTLTGKTLTDTQSDSYSEGKEYFLGIGNWSKSNYKTQQQQNHVGTTITTKNDASLESTEGDIKLSAATITSGGNLAIKAKRDLQLEGVISENSVHEKGHHKDAGQNRKWDNQSTTQMLSKTQLTAGKNLGLTAENNITTQGAKASAGKDLLINARNVKIDVMKTHNKETSDGRNIKNLGLGGKDHKHNKDSEEIVHSSEITADGTMLISAKENVSITGSTVKATKDGFVQAKDGGIRIDNAISTNTTQKNERTGVVFNITGSSKSADNSEEKSTGSEVVSDANLKIISKNDVDVIGSLVKSADELGIETLGDINIKAAQEKKIIDEQKTQLTINGFTNDDGNHQYKAGVTVKHTSESEKTDLVTHKGSVIEGGNVKLNADKDVKISGSELKTTQGDAEINANNVSFVAEKNTTTSDKEKETVGVDAYYTAGLDKAGSGAGVGYEDKKTHIDKSTSVVSKTDVKGDLNINAKKDLTNQGTNHNVEGRYAADADNVNNLAAENNETTTTKTNSVGVKYGVNVEYSGVTRPAIETLKNTKDLDITKVIEAVGNIDTDSLNAGVDLSVDVSKKENTSSNSQAVVTSIKSGDTKITAKRDVKDQGTKYQADKGGIEIDATNHIFEAATNRTEEKNKVVSGGVEARIYTKTGEDINIDAKGKGENKQQQTKAELAQTGSMKAEGDITINVKNNARYVGTDLDAGDGKIAITAGKEIKFDQATNHTSESHNNIDANAKLNVGTTPNTKDFGGGLGGGHSKGSTSADIAQVSHLQGKNGIELNAGKDITLQGTKFGSENTPTGDVQLTAGGKVDFQAAQSKTSKEDLTWSANINAGKNKSSSTSKADDGTKTHTNNKGFSAGAGVNVKNTSESSLKHQGGTINSDGAVTIKAGGRDQQAIHLQSTTITSKEATLAADKGGIFIESAQDKEHKTNWGANVNLNGSKKNTIKSDDQGVVDKDSNKNTVKNAVKLGAEVDKLESVTQRNSTINSDTITLNSAKNTELAGAVLQADQINGNIGGNLKIISREDTLNKTSVSASFGASKSNANAKNLIDKVAEKSPVGSDKIKTKLKEESTKVFDKAEEKFNTLGKAEDDSVQTISHTKKASESDDKDAKKDSAKVTSDTKDGKTVKAKTSDDKEDKKDKEDKEDKEDKKEDKAETKDTLLQKGAKFLGNKIKTTVSGTQVEGANGGAKVDVDIVSSHGVEEQSAIRGTKGVNLTVKGKTDLIGGKISSQDSDVKLKTNGLNQENIDGEHSEKSVKLNGSSSIADMAIDAAKDVMAGKTPLVGGNGKTEQKTTTGGITRE